MSHIWAARIWSPTGYEATCQHCGLTLCFITRLYL